MVSRSPAAKLVMCLRRKSTREELDWFNACKEIPYSCTCLSPCPQPNLNATAPLRRKGYKLGRRLFLSSKNRDGCLPARRKNVRLLWKPSMSESWRLPALHLVGKSSCAFAMHVHGDTHSLARKTKAAGKRQRDASSRAQKGGRKTLAVSIACFQLGLIKNPQTNHPKQETKKQHTNQTSRPTSDSSSKLIEGKKKTVLCMCCPPVPHPGHRLSQSTCRVEICWAVCFPPRWTNI